MKRLAVVVAVAMVAAACGDSGNSDEVDALQAQIDELTAQLQQSDSGAATSSTTSTPPEGDSTTTTSSSTTTAAPTTTSEPVEVGERYEITGSGASTVALERPASEFSTVSWRGTAPVRILLLDDNGDQQGLFGESFGDPAPGVQILDERNQTATFAEVSSDGDWTIWFNPAGYFSQAASDAGVTPEDGDTEILSVDGYQYISAGESASGVGDFIISARGFGAAVWTFEVPGCERPVETDVYDADGEASFSAGQYLLADEHQGGTVEQLIPADGIVQVATTCTWTISVPS